MKVRQIACLATLATGLGALPAKAVSWEMQAECHFISANGREQIENLCRIAGSSGQGQTAFTIYWEDGMKTLVTGRFITNIDYMVDGKPAIHRHLDSVTVLRTQSGNLIIFRKI